MGYVNEKKGPIPAQDTDTARLIESLICGNTKQLLDAPWRCLMKRVRQLSDHDSTGPCEFAVSVPYPVFPYCSPAFMRGRFPLRL